MHRTLNRWIAIANPKISKPIVSQNWKLLAEIEKLKITSNKKEILSDIINDIVCCHEQAISKNAGGAHEKRLMGIVQAQKDLAQKMSTISGPRVASPSTYAGVAAKGSDKVKVLLGTADQIKNKLVKNINPMELSLKLDRVVRADQSTRIESTDAAIKDKLSVLLDRWDSLISFPVKRNRA